MVDGRQVHRQPVKPLGDEASRRSAEPAATAAEKFVSEVDAEPVPLVLRVGEPFCSIDGEADIAAI